MTDTRHFAATVLATFEERGLRTDDDVRAAGGPSDTYMSGLRKAATGSPMRSLRSDTGRRIDAAAGWDAGSAMALWHNGASPTTRRPAAPTGDASVVQVSASVLPREGDIVGEYRSTAALPDGTLSTMAVEVAPGGERRITAIALQEALAGVHLRLLDATYTEETPLSRPPDIDLDDLDQDLEDQPADKVPDPIYGETPEQVAARAKEKKR